MPRSFGSTRAASKIAKLALRAARPSTSPATGGGAIASGGIARSTVASGTRLGSRAVDGRARLREKPWLAWRRSRTAAAARSLLASTSSCRKTFRARREA